MRPSRRRSGSSYLGLKAVKSQLPHVMAKPVASFTTWGYLEGKALADYAAVTIDHNGKEKEIEGSAVVWQLWLHW